jgi:hypothetical protein
MPRLSLWRENRGNDYKFIDRRISEMFTVGGTGILVHKYIGTGNDSTEADATKPQYQNQSIFNIQDLLFVENRDRKYDPDVYAMRGIYQRADQDFSLSQFGIFLAEGTLFMTFHLNDCVEILGRKLIPGDVLELQHLTDYWALDDSVPVALKRFYVVGDCSFASEGFSPTWYPHLWRCKIQPMVDSQEFKDILNKIKATPGNDPFEANANAASLGTYISNYEKYKNINEAVITQAEVIVPKSGYDTSKFYVYPTDPETNEPRQKGKKTNNPTIRADGSSVVTFVASTSVFNSTEVFLGANANLSIFGGRLQSNTIGNSNVVTIVGKLSSTSVRVTEPITAYAGQTITMIVPQLAVGGNARTATSKVKAGSGTATPLGKPKGYLVGDGTGPNGMTVATGVAFPSTPKKGDYFLRLDFVPNRLFRWDGKIWRKVEDVTRSNLTPGDPNNQTFRAQWLKEETWTDYQGNVRSGIASLSKAAKPEADN